MPLNFEFNPYLSKDSSGGGSLPNEIKQMLPLSASVSQESMRSSESIEHWFTSVTQIFEAESANIEFAQGKPLENYRALLAKRDMSPLEAIRVASTESATYITKYPHLPFFAPEFMSCFRLMRTAELIGGMNRGGESLFIGSGATISEVLALYIAPPTDEDLTKMTSADPDATKLRQKGIKRLNLKQPSQIPMLPGHATTIEPDSSYDTMFHLGSKAFPLPDDLLTRQQQTLHGALQSGWGTAIKLDSIVWYRADPQVLGFNLQTFFDPPEGNAEQVDGIISSFFLLFQRLKEGGTFGMTVGAGSSTDERKTRLGFIKVIRELLKVFPLEEKKEVSGFYLADDISSGMFAEPNGSVAGLFVTKRDELIKTTSTLQTEG